MDNIPINITTNFICGNDITPQEYFSPYHFYEKYDDSKKYNTNVYTYDYGFGNHKYINEIYSGGQNFGKYIVAQEIIDGNEKDELLKYCQCLYHTTSRFSPFKYLICQCCVGCIDSINQDQNVINETRKYMEHQKKSKYFYNIFSYFR